MCQFEDDKNFFLNNRLPLVLRLPATFGFMYITAWTQIKRFHLSYMYKKLRKKVSYSIQYLRQNKHIFLNFQHTSLGTRTELTYRRIVYIYNVKSYNFGPQCSGS